MDYLSYIREQPCLVCGIRSGKSDAHHIKALGMGTNRKKVSEMGHIEHGVVPLCRVHHQEFHTIGFKSFEERNHINLWRDCYRILVRWMQSNL